MKVSGETTLKDLERLMHDLKIGEGSLLFLSTFNANVWRARVIVITDGSITREIRRDAASPSAALELALNAYLEERSSETPQEQELPFQD